MGDLVRLVRSWVAALAAASRHHRNHPLTRNADRNYASNRNQK